MAKQCRRALVEGRVQGVWFRGSTQQQARKRGITGWAKNLPDGRVEVLMCGDADDLDGLQQWLREGPTMARVDRLTVTDETFQAYDSFSTG